MRRNDVVMYTNGDGAPFGFYGRVVRRVDADHVLWICTGKDIHVTNIKHLTVMDYVGKWEWSNTWNDKDEAIIQYYERDETGYPIWSQVKFVRPVRYHYMPSLRRLKQRASRHHKRNVWKTPLDYEYIYRKERG